MSNIYFTGLKHSGKTTLSSIVAKRANLPFYDLDKLIEEEIKPLSVREFYTLFGQERFMEEERIRFSSLLLTSSSFILSLGGGVSDNTELMERMKESGVIIYLDRREGDLFKTIMKKGIPPFLDKENPSHSFHLLYERRKKIYQEYADLTIDLGPYTNKRQTANLIYNKLKEHGYV